MSRRATARAVAIVVLFTGLCFLAPSPSRAATIESGWWWRANTGTNVNQSPAPPLVLPAPAPAAPTPPNTEGGLQVAALQDGAFSVAAVRVDQELTSLTLRVAPNGDANGMNAKLVACQAMSPWTPVNAGPWDAKPVVACDLINGGGSVAGIRAPDGTSWTFPVAPIANEGKTDLVIVPLADSDVAEGFATPFQLVFAPPTEADLVVAPVTTEPSEGPAEDVFVDDGSVVSGGDFSSFDPTFASGTGDVAPVVEPALEENEQAPILPTFATADEDDGSRLFGAAMVLVAIGLFYWASRQTTPPIHSLVGAGVGREIPVSAPQLGGLGRFARERVGKPPSLQ